MQRMPLLKRAQVPYRDMYSLRWTFVSLARASGEAAFNVSRVIGSACYERGMTAADHSMCRRDFLTDDRLAPNPPGSAAPSAIAHRPQRRYRPVPDQIPSKAPQKDRPEFGSRCSY